MPKREIPLIAIEQEKNKLYHEFEGAYSYFRIHNPCEYWRLASKYVDAMLRFWLEHNEYPPDKGKQLEKLINEFYNHNVL